MAAEGITGFPPLNLPSQNTRTGFLCRSRGFVYNWRRRDTFELDELPGRDSLRNTACSSRARLRHPLMSMNSGAQVLRICPVCGSGNGSEYLHKGQLMLVQCTGCEMIYANPVPQDYASGKFYDDSSSYYLSAAKLESDYAEVRFARELRLFRAQCPSGKVLDVGCSSGAFLHQLAKQFPGNYEVLGTDASGPALDYAESRGVKVVRGDFLKQDFGGERFDAVTFWAVLEHLAEPGLFLEKSASLLRPGGLCFVLVPNMGSLAARVLGARYRYIYLQHLNYFTARTLERLARTWFSVVQCRYTHFNPLVIWQDWRDRGAEVSNEDRAELLRRTTVYKQTRWLLPVRAGYKVAEAALGTMKLADNLAIIFRKH